MDNQNQSQFPIRLDPLLVIFLIIQIIFIVLFLLSISKFFQNDKFNNSPDHGPNMEIENVSIAIPEDHVEWANLVEWALFNTSLSDTEGQYISRSSTIAYIRDGTVKTQYFKKQDINFVSAIVDIPELTQSYRIFLEYPNNKHNIGIVEYDNPDVIKPYSILCLDETSEIIYTNFNCQESPAYASRQEIVSRMLSYFEFSNFAPIYYSENDSNNIEISPYSFDEISNDTKEMYIQQVKDAIASLGISPNIFTYNVMNPEEIKYFYPRQ